MAIHLKLTLFMERRCPEAAFHLLPTQRYLKQKCSCFSGRIFCCGSVETVFCAIIWRFFLIAVEVGRKDA